jgi:hypothetical protein
MTRSMKISAHFDSEYLQIISHLAHNLTQVLR